MSEDAPESAEAVIARAQMRTTARDGFPELVKRGLGEFIAYNRSNQGGWVKQREALRWARENGWRGQEDKFSRDLESSFGAPTWTEVCRGD